MADYLLATDLERNRRILRQESDRRYAGMQTAVREITTGAVVWKSPLDPSARKRVKVA